MSDRIATRYTDLGTDYILTEHLDANANRIGDPLSISRVMAITRLMSRGDTARAYLVVPPAIIGAIRTVCDMSTGYEEVNGAIVALREWLNAYADKEYTE